MHTREDQHYLGRSSMPADEIRESSAKAQLVESAVVRGTEVAEQYRTAGEL